MLAPPPALEENAVHVWRIALGDATQTKRYHHLLSAEEQGRARRFFRKEHGDRYVIAHGALRCILAHYVSERAESLEFSVSEHGKPSLAATTPAGASGIEFNLSHSGDLALVAVARGRSVGVDLERWSEETEHLELAERFFSPAERDALRALADSREKVVAGFFAAWSRKEAYLKATGHGISRGLHHFDVTLGPGEPARLLGDRLDVRATERWEMLSLEPAPGFSAALVAESPIVQVVQLDVGEGAPVPDSAHATLFGGHV